jgi:vacuolar-type H+-ATPase subunit E/Vma4
MKISEKQIVLCKQWLQTFCEMIDSNLKKLDEPDYYMDVQRQVVKLICDINEQQSEELREVE